MSFTTTFGVEDDVEGVEVEVDGVSLVTDVELLEVLGVYVDDDLKELDTGVVILFGMVLLFNVVKSFSVTKL